MPVEISSLSQLQAFVNSPKATVVDFYATWCGPCKAVAPEYDAMSRSHDAAKVTFCKVDVDRAQDCARQYNVTAMPTFMVFVNGELIEAIRGANMARLGQVVTYAVSQVKGAAAFTGSGRSLGGGSGQSALLASNAAPPSATVVHELGHHILKLQKALVDSDDVSKKDACDAIHAHLVKDTPTGFSLIPLLMTSGTSALGDITVALSAYFDYIDTMDAVAKQDGQTIVFSVVQVLVNALTTSSWSQLNNGQVHTALRNLVKCGRHVRAALVASRKFRGGSSQRSGDQLAKHTLLGGALSVGSNCRKSAHPIAQMAQQQHIMHLFQLFPITNGGVDGAAVQLERSKTDTSIHDIQTEHQAVASYCFPIFRELLSDKESTRQPTLEWIHSMISGNKELSKTMSDRTKATPETAMMSFTSVLIELALPIVTATGFDAASIPVSYVYDPAALLGFDAGVERIAHFDSENPLPVVPGAASKVNEEGNSTQSSSPLPAEDAYAPRVHLFFAAVRAVDLMYSSHLLKYDSNARHLQHPAIAAQDRHYLLAQNAMIRALLGGQDTGLKCIRFLNGVARWLLHVMGVGRNGEVPATVPVGWTTLPQSIVDMVIRGTKLMTTMQVVVDSSEIQDIMSLTLVLMGNSSFFPKPHTHALFPPFLVSLLNSPQSSRSIQGHKWFQSHIVKGCILCYIAMEKSYYEKLQTRYELSHCLRVFLKENALCAAVKVEFEEVKSDVLERFSHMVTADVNAAVDSILSNLQKMNRKINGGGDEATSSPTARTEAPAAQRNNNRGGDDNEDDDGDDNNNANEGEASYDQLGRDLQMQIQLFDVSVDVFFELSNRFPKGVAQNMVAQQISQMLARSITTFTGPKCRDLKIPDADKYSFRPRDILTKLVECLVQFQDAENFLRHLCECGVPLQSIYDAMGSIVHRRLVREDLVARLSKMYNQLLSTAKAVEDEVEIWEDAPDFALDVLLSTPLTDPVAIPSHCESMDDLLVTNRATLHHSLLSEPKNPYTKEYLDEKIVAEFNSRPDVSAAIAQLKTKIDEWHRGALELFQAKKMSAEKA
jgi:thioredoxin